MGSKQAFNSAVLRLVILVMERKRELCGARVLG